MRISLEQALDILMDHVTQGRTERKPLEQCLGLVLSQDVFALLDMPPFSRSAQDGYAFQAKDSAGASKEQPVELKVTGKYMPGIFRGRGKAGRSDPHHDRSNDSCRCRLCSPTGRY